MKTFLCILLILFFLVPVARAGLLINEFSCGSSDDWVELFLCSDKREKLDISPLFVTMYYGKNEPLGTEPITLYSYDRAETPWDDRFAVVHLNGSVADETDRTGDTNRNGALDVYCRGHIGGLWNTDGVIAIDSDNEPSNGGMIDFVAYSSRDGSPHQVVASHMLLAQGFAQWQTCPVPDIQSCAVFIGSEGLPSGMSVSRRGGTDTNSASDFEPTQFATPGRPNLTGIAYRGRKLFRVLHREITIVPGHPLYGKGDIPLFVLQTCNLRVRVYSSTGKEVYKSMIYSSVQPGLFNASWHPLAIRQSLPTGLYFCVLEASSTAYRLNQRETLKIILSRYR